MRVTMTTFMNFVFATGMSARIQVVQDCITEYDLKRDYYAPVRRTITAIEKGQATRSALRHISTPDRTKARHFGACIDGYEKWATQTPSRRWLGGPPTVVWRHGEFEVGVNAELLLSVDEAPTAIKLYFSQSPIPRGRSTVALHLLQWAYGKKFASVAILDVRRAKLVGPSARPPANLDLALESEAAAFQSLADGLASRSGNKTAE